MRQQSQQTAVSSQGMGLIAGRKLPVNTGTPVGFLKTPSAGVSLSTHSKSCIKKFIGELFPFSPTKFGLL